MEIKIVGEVKFRNRVLAVYGDLDAPMRIGFISFLIPVSPFLDEKIREAVSDSNR